MDIQDLDLPTKNRRRAERRRRSQVKFARRLRAFSWTWWWARDLSNDIDAHSHERRAGEAAAIVLNAWFSRVGPALSCLRDTPTRFSWPADSWDMTNLTISTLRREPLPEEERRVRDRRSRYAERHARRKAAWAQRTGWRTGGRCTCGFVLGFDSCPNCNKAVKARITAERAAS